MTEREELKKALSDVLVLRAQLERAEYSVNQFDKRLGVVGKALEQKAERISELENTIKQMRDLVFTFSINVRLTKKIARMAAKVEETA